MEEHPKDDEGLVSAEVIEAAIMQPDTGREVAKAEHEAFVEELKILMRGIEEAVERGRLVIDLGVSFIGEGEGDGEHLAADNLGFNFSN